MPKTRSPLVLCPQQDCTLGQVSECAALPLANNTTVPALGYSHGAQRVKSPLKGALENEILPIPRALTSLPRYRDTFSSSQYLGANHPGSTSSTIDADKDGKPSIISRLLDSQGEPRADDELRMKGRPIRLSSHTISLPVAQAHSPSHGDRCDIPLINATTHRIEGGVQDCASDNTAHASIAYLSPNCSIPIPHAVYLRDRGSVSRFGEPPFVHHAGTGSTMDLAS